MHPTVGSGLLLEHWELALLVATWSVIGVLAAKLSYDWRQRRFAQQVNFSLNTSFLQISGRDRDMVMVAVLNVLSERFSDVFVARALGIPARTDTFLFGLTWERYGEMKNQKLRVMVIKRSDLQTLFDGQTDAREIGVAEESPRPRIRTLRQMFELWTSSHADDRSAIGEIELGMPTESG